MNFEMNMEFDSTVILSYYPVRLIQFDSKSILNFITF